MFQSQPALDRLVSSVSSALGQLGHSWVCLCCYSSPSHAAGAGGSLKGPGNETVAVNCSDCSALGNEPSLVLSGHRDKLHT